MAVHQRRDGRWIVHYRERGTGKLKHEYFGRGLEAEKLARARNEELQLNPYVKRTLKRTSPTFNDLAAEYMLAKSGSVSAKQIANLESKLKSIIDPLIGHLEADRITAPVIDRYVNARIRAGVKLTTIHRELSDVQAILNWSVARRYITSNPIAGLAKPTRDDEIIAPPTREEIRRLIAHAPPHLVRAMLLAYHLGARPGTVELLQVQWADVDWLNWTVTIRSAKKGGIMRRQVPVAESFYLTLCGWCQEDRKRTPNPTHIIHYHGEKVACVRKSFTATKKRAGITRRLTMYAFRHAFVTYLLDHGADIKAVSEMAGHTSVNTTLRIYRHTSDALKRAAVDNLPDIQMYVQEMPTKKNVKKER